MLVFQHEAKARTSSGAAAEAPEVLATDDAGPSKNATDFQTPIESKEAFEAAAAEEKKSIEAAVEEAQAVEMARVRVAELEVCIKNWAFSRHASVVVYRDKLKITNTDTTRETIYITLTMP